MFGSTQLVRRKYQSAISTAVAQCQRRWKTDLLYTSPLSSVVNRLRTFSLTTCFLGTVGLPAVIAYKGGDLPSSGMMAVALLFVSGSVGSTAAIHYVFSPHIFTIERIPIRQCHFKKKDETGTEEAEDKPATPSKETLLKATTKSLFLRNQETVFDVSDITLYKGYHPLTTMIVKGKPLYLVESQVYHQPLRDALRLDEKEKEFAESEKKSTSKNPDDDLH
jgi:hypothetical protein